MQWTIVTWILFTCGPMWLACAQSTPECTTRPCAASLRGPVAETTGTCVIPSDHSNNAAGTQLPAGTTIFGPMENGFTSRQDNVLRGLGGVCGTDPSVAYSSGGRDTKVAVEEMAYHCQVQLPRRETVGGKEMYINLLDECGGHTKYHFHESFGCCYEESGTHSAQIGVGVLGVNDRLYGKWEDFSLGDPDGLPLLDACGGHYGPTPDNEGVTYHYHVQEKAPFTFGCYGPNADGSLVTVEQCRALYSTCDGVEVTFKAGFPNARDVAYDIDCPCYDGDGSNLGTVALKVFDGSPTAPPGATRSNATGSVLNASSRMTFHVCILGVVSLLFFAAALVE